MNKIFSQHFKQSDIEEMSGRVYRGYRAVEHLFTVYPLLGSFIPGADIRPYLINISVQYELTKLSSHGFSYKIEKNAARNCSHVQLLKDNIRITAHYLGSTTLRKAARHAICRQPLAELNQDLFKVFGNEEEIKVLDGSYFHLYYQGLKTPEIIMLAIPDAEQKGIIGEPLILPKIELGQEEEKIEEIKETMEYILKEVSKNEHQQPNKEANG
ncbi:MAG: hypothetical protein ACXWT3_14245 [Methylococcaceae bacterium]